jgi:hypothetical protein
MAPFRIDDHTGRLRPGDPAYGQLGVVGYCRTNANNHGINQRPQAMQVGKARSTIDILRVPRFRRNAAIERLADLADNHQLINSTPAERAENFTPGLRKGLVTGPENIAKLQPWVG